MKTHLLQAHSIDLSDKRAESPLTQPVLSFTQSVAQRASRADVLLKLTVWLANSFRPYTTVEDPDFRDMIKMLRPDLELPKKDKIRNLAKKLSLLVKAQVRSNVIAHVLS